MAKKTIYLIRHGETELNRKGVVQGRGVDTDLNEKGRLQADAFYTKYKDVAFDKVYISSLKRTYQTAQSFINDGIPYQKLSGLDEISWGELEGQLPDTGNYGLFKELTHKWAMGETARTLPGGESPEEVVKRQNVALAEILSHENEKCILLTMHGRAIRILLTTLLQRPLVEMDTFQHSNTCLYLLEYDYDTEKVEVILANDTSHLEEFGH